MKGVSCGKLSIDRSKAPKGVTTFHLISTFGNFQFPLEGEFAGGIVAQSLAGIGKKSSKGRNSRVAVANATGAKVTKEDFPLGESDQTYSVASTTSYSIKFISHSPESPAPAPALQPTPECYKEHSRPKVGFALKMTSGSRVLFTARQKEIMIEFFNKHYSTNIRSDPRDVIDAMKHCGEKPLTATQIKSFWLTHSQKRKKQLENMHIQMAQLLPAQTVSAAQQPVQRQAPATAQTSSQQSSTCTTSSPTTGPSHAVTPQCTPTGFSQAPTANSIVNLCSTCSNPSEVLHNESVTEWRFPESFSQSLLNGRNGSYACVFIALCCAQIIAEKNLPVPLRTETLPHDWCHLLYDVMERGNSMHEQLCDVEAMVVAVMKPLLWQQRNSSCLQVEIGISMVILCRETLRISLKTLQMLANQQVLLPSLVDEGCCLILHLVAK